MSAYNFVLLDSGFHESIPDGALHGVNRSTSCPQACELHGFVIGSSTIEKFLGVSAGVCVKGKNALALAGSISSDCGERVLTSAARTGFSNSPEETL